MYATLTYISKSNDLSLTKKYSTCICTEINENNSCKMTAA